jgi:hypothetical protein
MSLDAAANARIPVLNLVHELGSAPTRKPAHCSPQWRFNLAGIDLNLLLGLEALLLAPGATIAAGRVGLSQPAMNRALGRLRALFNDRLLMGS